jgi:hypothetical protein
MKCTYEKFQFSKLVSVMTVVFWNITSCKMSDLCQSFRETCPSSSHVPKNSSLHFDSVSFYTAPLSHRLQPSPDSKDVLNYKGFSAQTVRLKFCYP